MSAVFSYLNQVSEPAPDMFASTEYDVSPVLRAIITIMYPGDTLIVESKYDLVSGYSEDRRLQTVLELVQDKNACLKFDGEVYDFRA